MKRRQHGSAIRRRGGLFGCGIHYRRDGRVVLRARGVAPGSWHPAEIVLGKVLRLRDGWHFYTPRVAPSGRARHRESLGLAPDPFDFEMDGEPYARRHLACKALLALLRDGAAVDLDARRGLPGDSLEPPRGAT